MMRRVAQARRMRRQPTPAEAVLWYRLRNRQVLGCKFRRQVPIDRYVVDFMSEEAKLIIEVDGAQHAERTGPGARRSQVLEAMGYHVLRFWNADVSRNIDGVMEEIVRTLELRGGTPSP